MTQALTDPKQAQVAQAEFEKKMQDRMRAAMGDLMPDSVLAGIVAKGIEEAFFKPQVRTTDSWRTDVKDPPWTVTFLKAECERQVREAVTKWLADNPNKVKECLDNAIAGGLAASVVRAIDTLMQQQLMDLRQGVMAVIEKLRVGT